MMLKISGDAPSSFSLQTTQLKTPTHPPRTELRILVRMSRPVRYVLILYTEDQAVQNDGKWSDPIYFEVPVSNGFVIPPTVAARFLELDENRCHFVANGLALFFLEQVTTGKIILLLYRWLC